MRRPRAALLVRGILLQQLSWARDAVALRLKTSQEHRAMTQEPRATTNPTGRTHFLVRLQREGAVLPVSAASRKCVPKVWGTWFGHIIQKVRAQAVHAVVLSHRKSLMSATAAATGCPVRQSLASPSRAQTLEMDTVLAPTLKQHALAKSRLQTHMAAEIHTLNKRAAHGSAVATSTQSYARSGSIRAIQRYPRTSPPFLPSACLP
mmetsp:Transcript_84433/g.219740  ORF Transcript_84433/g.219740 Transcript_84433/m.219740 type:complete len:206 (-) Transcript_84433:78-695(-)